jgi:hypothetical protein
MFSLYSRYPSSSDQYSQQPSEQQQQFHIFHQQQQHSQQQHQQQQQQFPIPGASSITGSTSTANATNSMFLPPHYQPSPPREILANSAGAMSRDAFR